MRADAAFDRLREILLLYAYIRMLLISLATSDLLRFRYGHDYAAISYYAEDYATYAAMLRCFFDT